MKTILLLAVLIFAAQSSPLQDFYRGFILNLPMKTELQNQMLTSGLECVTSFEEVMFNLIGSLYRNIPEKHYLDALRNLLVADDILEHKIAPQCAKIHSQINQYLLENRVRPEGEDWDKYLDNFYWTHRKTQDLIAQIVRDVLIGRYSGAGEKFAMILKLATRMTKVEYYQIPDRKVSAPFNQQKFLAEFVYGFLEEFNALNYYNNQTIACANDLFNTTQTIVLNPSLYRGDFLTVVHAVLEGALHVTDSIQRCSETVDVSPLLKLWTRFIHSPERAIAKVVFNSYLHSVEETQARYYFYSHFRNQDYSLAGKQVAQFFKVPLGDLSL